MPRRSRLGNGARLASGVGPRQHQETKYSGRYSDAALDAWAEWLAGQVRAGRPIYSYFNNDT